MLINVLYVLPIEIWILMNHHPPASSIYLSFPLLIPHRIWRPLHKKSIGSYLLALSPHPLRLFDQRITGGMEGSPADAPQEERFHLNLSAASERRRWDIVHLICFLFVMQGQTIRKRNEGWRGKRCGKWSCIDAPGSFLLEMRDFRFLIIGSGVIRMGSPVWRWTRQKMNVWNKYKTRGEWINARTVSCC